MTAEQKAEGLVGDRLWLTGRVLVRCQQHGHSVVVLTERQQEMADVRLDAK